MTLQSSGSMTFQDIVDELGTSFPLTIPSDAVRDLAGKASGSLVFPTDFYGKGVVEVVDTKAEQTGGSFTGVSFGADTTGRRVALVVFHGDAGSSPGTTPTCTIGGVAATRHEARTTGDGAGNAAGVAIFSAGSVSGTSGTVDVTWGSSLPMSIVALRIVGFASSAHDSGGENSDANVTSRNFSIDIPANGCLICGAACAADLAITWTNATERGDALTGATRRSWAWDAQMSLQTGRSVTATIGSANRMVACGVSFARA